MAEMPPTEWARRLGASPPKRMVASWPGSSIGPAEYKVAVRCIAPAGRLPSLVLDALAKVTTRAATFALDRKSPIQSSARTEQDQRKGR
jgi:hypothetical protein